MSHVSELKNEVEEIYNTLSTSSNAYQSSIGRMQKAIKITDGKIESILESIRLSISNNEDVKLIKQIDENYEADLFINKSEYSKGVRDLEYKKKALNDLVGKRGTNEKSKQSVLNNVIAFKDLMTITETKISESNREFTNTKYEIRNLDNKISVYNVDGDRFDSGNINVTDENSKGLFAEYKENKKSFKYGLYSLVGLSAGSNVTKKQTAYFKELENKFGKEIDDIYSSFSGQLVELDKQDGKLIDISKKLKELDVELKERKQVLVNTNNSYEDLSLETDKIEKKIKDVSAEVYRFQSASLDLDGFVAEKTKKDSLKKLTIENIFDFDLPNHKELESLKSLSEMSRLLKEDFNLVQNKHESINSMKNSMGDHKAKIDKLKDYSKVNSKLESKLGSSLKEFKNNNATLKKNLKDDVANVQKRADAAYNNNYTQNDISNYNIMFLPLLMGDTGINTGLMNDTKSVFDNMNSDYSSMMDSISSVGDTVSSISDVASSPALSCSSGSPSSSCSSSSGSSCGGGGGGCGGN